MKKQTKYQKEKAYGEKIIEAFGLKDADPVQTYRTLRRLEKRGNRLAVEDCTVELREGEHEKRATAILKHVDRVTGYKAKGVPVFLNGDPRGYALKVRADWMEGNKTDLHTDWGGYGILAPDLSE